jgi:hypothetical protein
MAATARPSILRKVLEEQLSLLAGELDAFFEAELASRELENRQAARSELAENLNQALRRLSCAENFEQMSVVLVDSSQSFASCLAVFSVTGGIVKGEQVRGLAGEDAAERFRALEFAIPEAAAFAGALETGEPMVAMSTPREVSAAVVGLFQHKPEDRAYIAPIRVRSQAMGLLYACGSIEMPPLEMLAHAASLSLAARQPPEPPPVPPQLVTIQSGRPAPPQRGIPGSWSELAPDDQQVHLRAQRFARVQIAGMRLFSADAVRNGRARKDIYGMLGAEIDSAREMFRQTFLPASSTMVDYLHVELLRSLTNDDPALLGPSYPGPLV